MPSIRDIVLSNTQSILCSLESGQQEEKQELMLVLLDQMQQQLSDQYAYTRRQIFHMYQYQESFLRRLMHWHVTRSSRWAVSKIQFEYGLKMETEVATATGAMEQKRKSSPFEFESQCVLNQPLMKDSFVYYLALKRMRAKRPTPSMVEREGQHSKDWWICRRTNQPLIPAFLITLAEALAVDIPTYEKVKKRLLDTEAAPLPIPLLGGGQGSKTLFWVHGSTGLAICVAESRRDAELEEWDQPMNRPPIVSLLLDQHRLQFGHYAHRNPKLGEVENVLNVIDSMMSAMSQMLSLPLGIWSEGDKPIHQFLYQTIYPLIVGYHEEIVLGGGNDSKSTQPIDKVDDEAESRGQRVHKRRDKFARVSIALVLGSLYFALQTHFPTFRCSLSPELQRQVPKLHVLLNKSAMDGDADPIFGTSVGESGLHLFISVFYAFLKLRKAECLTQPWTAVYDLVFDESRQRTIDLLTKNAVHFLQKDLVSSAPYKLRLYHFLRESRTHQLKLRRQGRRRGAVGMGVGVGVGSGLSLLFSQLRISLPLERVQAPVLGRQFTNDDAKIAAAKSIFLAVQLYQDVGRLFLDPMESDRIRWIESTLISREQYHRPSVLEHLSNADERRLLRIQRLAKGGKGRRHLKRDLYVRHSRYQSVFRPVSMIQYMLGWNPVRILMTELAAGEGRDRGDEEANARPDVEREVGPISPALFSEWMAFWKRFRTTNDIDNDGAEAAMSSQARTSRLVKSKFPHDAIRYVFGVAHHLSSTIDQCLLSTTPSHLSFSPKDEKAGMTRLFGDRATETNKTHFLLAAHSRYDMTVSLTYAETTIYLAFIRYCGFCSTKVPWWARLQAISSGLWIPRFPRVDSAGGKDQKEGSGDKKGSGDGDGDGDGDDDPLLDEERVRKEELERLDLSLVETDPLQTKIDKLKDSGKIYEQTHLVQLIDYLNKKTMKDCGAKRDIPTTIEDFRMVLEHFRAVTSSVGAVEVGDGEGLKKKKEKENEREKEKEKEKEKDGDADKDDDDLDDDDDEIQVDPFIQKMESIFDRMEMVVEKRIEGVHRDSAREGNIMTTSDLREIEPKIGAEEFARRHAEDNDEVDDLMRFLKAHNKTYLHELLLLLDRGEFTDLLCMLQETGGAAAERGEFADKKYEMIGATTASTDGNAVSFRVLEHVGSRFRSEARHRKMLFPDKIVKQWPDEEQEKKVGAWKKKRSKAGLDGQGLDEHQEDDEDETKEKELDGKMPHYDIVSEEINKRKAKWDVMFYNEENLVVWNRCETTSLASAVELSEAEFAKYMLWVREWMRQSFIVAPAVMMEGKGTGKEGGAIGLEAFRSLYSKADAEFKRDILPFITSKTEDWLQMLQKLPYFFDPSILSMNKRYKVKAVPLFHRKMYVELVQYIVLRALRCLEMLGWDDSQRTTKPCHLLAPETALIQSHLEKNESGAGARRRRRRGKIFKCGEDGVSSNRFMTQYIELCVDSLIKGYIDLFGGNRRRQTRNENQVYSWLAGLEKTERMKKATMSVDESEWIEAQAELSVALKWGGGGRGGGREE